MSREALIISPNYRSKFERDGNYVSRSATSHKPSMDCRTNGSQVLSVEVTDKSIRRQHQHCNNSTRLTASCINKTAERQVPFPRSNSVRRINAQLPKAMRKWNFHTAKTAKELEKAQNSTDWILRQNRIEMNQSASCVSSQSATPLIDQSEPRISAITVQSEATRVGPDPYKSCRICPFDITAISKTDDTSTTEISSATSSTSNFATLTGSFQSHFTTLSSSTPRMTRTKQTARKDRESRYPRATRPYVCGLCRHESTQSTNHRRHMLTHHALRLDGTQATGEEIARARGWNVAGRDRRKAARAMEAQTSSTAARASSAMARTSSTAEHPSSSKVRSREFVSTDESEGERRSTSSCRPTPAATAG